MPEQLITDMFDGTGRSEDQLDSVGPKEPENPGRDGGFTRPIVIDHRKYGAVEDGKHE